MMHTELLRTRLATRERMHALGYTKGEIDAPTAPTIYFDLGNPKVRSRFKWIGKYNPGHCFLCTACLSRETAEYPCRRTAAGMRVCLKTTGAKSLDLLVESPYWNATKTHVLRTAGEDAGFGIVVCKRQCLARWRSAEAEDEGKLDDSNNRITDSGLLSRSSSIDLDLAADLMPSVKRARPPNSATRPSPPPPGPDSTILKQPPLTSTASYSSAASVALPSSHPPPTTLTSSPWMALALGHMQLQATMAHVTTLRARLATLERMHALGYDKSDVQRVLEGRPKGDLQAPGVPSV
ncbi:hypothetical protein GGF32_002566 [Allomyces javanicus]|nr:hypothetical protein GGF32_002566 [Allomyces javanicus]